MDVAELISYIGVYFRWMLAFIFLLAGISKARDIKEFASTIRLFRLLPRRLSDITARFVIVTELVIGFSLLGGLFTQTAAIVAAFLFTLFSIAILVNWIRGNIFHCNCFGPYYKGKIGGKAIRRNIILIAICLMVLQFYDGYLAIETIWRSGTGIPNYPFERFALSTGMIVATITSFFFVREILGNFISLKTK